MNAEITFKTGKTITIENVKEIRELWPGDKLKYHKPENFFISNVPTIFIGKETLSVHGINIDSVVFKD